ncbi:MAG TPA: DUF2000 domain-containing protein [Candidatus Dojkabacteria bacterium]|jgi:hypothetical protein
MNEPTTKKFVAVLNKKIEPGRAMNALGHMAAGLAAQFEEREEMRFQDYSDMEGNIYPSISDNPFIVLKAKNSNKLKELKKQLVEKNIKHTVFLDTMVEGTFEDQHERTKSRTEEEIEFWGVCFFAENDTARELTSKFSIY